MYRRMWVGVAVLLVSLVAASCGGGGGKPSGEQPSGPSAGAVVTVSEKEWTITFSPAALKAGTLKLTLKNEGSIEHNFIIKEANVEVDSIQPGQSKQVTVTLKPGTYTVLCNIPGHAEAGMQTSIQVQ
ncbi:MAG TPA: cupredoxin domain-containing protein [bacterium]|nr:cupredoxin domain-containing protein [bacterium]